MASREIMLHDYNPSTGKRRAGEHLKLSLKLGTIKVVQIFFGVNDCGVSGPKLVYHAFLCQ